MPKESILSRVLRLRPVTYKYKKPQPGLPDAGFIAQEVEELFPEAVTEKDGHKAIFYSHFGVIAIKAIQEQQEQIDALNRALGELRAEVDRLKLEASGID